MSNLQDELSIFGACSWSSWLSDRYLLVTVLIVCSALARDRADWSVLARDRAICLFGAWSWSSWLSGQCLLVFELIVWSVLARDWVDCLTGVRSWSSWLFDRSKAQPIDQHYKFWRIYVSIICQVWLTLHHQKVVLNYLQLNVLLSEQFYISYH